MTFPNRQRKGPRAVGRAAGPRPPEGKARIRATVRRGSRCDRAPLVASKLRAPAEPTLCGRCGVVFAHKVWRRPRALTLGVWMRAARSLCPACQQVAQGQYFGRIVITGLDASEEGPVRRRIKNVADRAGFTQPERRIVSITRDGGTLEVKTTSQKLAHRIVHELAKAFGGRPRFAWSTGDGRLFATWAPR
jgi:hypothetical protein